MTAAAKLPRTHNLVGLRMWELLCPGLTTLWGAGHVGVALPGIHNFVGAARVGAAELPQGPGREQRKCLAKQEKQNGNGKRRPSKTIDCLTMRLHMSCVLGQGETTEGCNQRHEANNNCTTEHKRRLAVMDRQVPWPKIKGKKA